MHHPAHQTVRLAALLPLLLFAVIGSAEPAKKDNGAAIALRKAQGAIRELTEQRTALEAEVQALKDKLASAESRVRQLEPLTGQVEQQKAALEQLRGNASALQSQLGSAHERELSLAQKNRAVNEQSRKVHADNQLLVQAVKERETWISRCGERNKSLVDANQMLLDRYRDKSFWQGLKEAEPLTGIAAVDAENKEQDYRFKLQDLQITPFEAQTPDPATAKSPQPAEEQDDNEPE